MVTRTSQNHEFINVKDIVDEIERKFAVDSAHRNWKGTGQIMVRCPKCKDKKYHLGLNFAKNVYNCFRCSFAGRLTEFLRSHQIPFATKSEIVSPVVTSNALKIKFPKDHDRDEEIATKAKKYLLMRGFDLKFVTENFKIWAVTDRNQYYFGYLIIYLNDYAFYARKFLTLTEKHQKHVIRKSDKEMELYFAYEKNNSNTILVVESMFNLMKAAQNGYDAVCIFGKNHWAGLVEYLKKHKPTKNICLCFDSDVKVLDIQKFVRKVQKAHQHIPFSYIHPEDMPCNDIAMMNKTTLIRTVNKRRPTDGIFLDTIYIITGV